MPTHVDKSPAGTLRTFRAFTRNTLNASILLLCAWVIPDSPGHAGATIVETPYQEQKVVIDFFLDHPDKLGAGLYWLRAIFQTLNAEPYGIAPDFIDAKVVIHGTEIVALAKKNYAKYKEVVERMRYYTEFGVEFKVCALAAAEYGYEPEDFHDFVQIIPNAMTEIVHWQSQGYGLIIPQVLEKNVRIDEIR